MYKRQEEPLAELKASIAANGSDVFQQMVKDFLINNSHRTTVEMVPSKTYEEETVKVRDCDNLVSLRMNESLTHPFPPF